MKKELFRAIIVIFIIFINIVVSNTVFAADDDFPRVNIVVNQSY